jgi:hypothetical protein
MGQAKRAGVVPDEPVIDLAGADRGGIFRGVGGSTEISENAVGTMLVPS